MEYNGVGVPNMEPSLYVETTIPSFVIGGISPNLVTAGHQLTTRRWWEERRHDYRLYVSSLVEEEIADGNVSYAEQRLTLVADLARLVIVPDTARLADYLFAYLHLPQSAAPDAMHLAVASHYTVDYLLTWNLKHLANGRVRRALDHLRATTGIFIPTICTPEELSDWEDEVW
jgi:predicted nucleic acid-binding protein